MPGLGARLRMHPPTHRAFAKKLNDAPLAIVDKRRSAHNVSEVMNLIGDVKGKVAVLVDDMIDTAGTITNAAKVLCSDMHDDFLCVPPFHSSLFPHGCIDNSRSTRCGP
jgi:phosphoribosylpyrophosphate synthetase